MNTYPCNKAPIQFINCCQVMDCIDIKSSDNSVTVVKDECGVDLTITGNNLSQILKFNNSECVTVVTEFIDGKLNVTTSLDYDCIIAKIAEDICNICTPPVCSPMINLTVVVAS